MKYVQGIKGSLADWVEDVVHGGKGEAYSNGKGNNEHVVIIHISVEIIILLTLAHNHDAFDPEIYGETGIEVDVDPLVVPWEEH